MDRTQRETEAALVARWAAGELVGRWLRTEQGEEIRVLFPGRPGGPAGPDFRDAVLLRRDGRRMGGDVELHLRARGWQAHGHACDPRYDRVVLHVVRYAEGVSATRLASGEWVPLVELDLANSPANAGRRNAQSRRPSWPCENLSRRVGPAAVRELLSLAGDDRFARRAEDFARQLAAPGPSAPEDSADLRSAECDSAPRRWSAIDRVLCIALAEGLAYGRDRGALRRAGEWLVAGSAPDGLLRALPRLSALDAPRLEGLLALHARWADTGPWAPLRAALATGTPATGARELTAALHVPGGLVSSGRAAILVANVVLPCAAAWATLHGDAALGSRARTVYAALPGLPSNQITREMVRQLGLGRQPAGARAQQGLHRLWAEHCREKRCETCPCALPSSRGGDRTVTHTVVLARFASYDRPAHVAARHILSV